MSRIKDDGLLSDEWRIAMVMDKGSWDRLEARSSFDSRRKLTGHVRLPVRVVDASGSAKTSCEK